MWPVMHLRLIVPSDRSERVLNALVADPRATSIVRLPGAARRPEGDMIECDVTREATSDVLAFLKAEGLYDDGAVALSSVDAAPSRNAQAAEKAAPGAPDDAVIWDAVVDQAYNEAGGSWVYYAFLTLATMIASVAVVTDSAILVVGAMVVGPEFGVVAALAVGLFLGKGGLARRSAVLLVRGFALAIALTVIAALLARAVGWVDVSDVTAARPLTGFIWRPDRWSVVVAVLAGCAGVLSQTAGRGNALVGVFISVTTVPAAGDLALSIALWAPGHIGGAAAQLGINLAGMTIAGVVTLLLQRVIWRSYLRVKRRAGARVEA
ncbi:putative hydrophobic protein (TIGR00271 family) [Kribbella kalugense]|uniref:Putative hydrophobic protein (TIGR00271 family) n=2 Tax=Kribbella kalugense TaxID=2512221 RepID=A0A4R7ZWF5_9ACTN|nr:putative hydrophobic protein (TIGR00271 family) [Kribbella kalugense]